MGIKKGEYKILETLNISRSLRNIQKDPTITPGIYKAVATSIDGTNVILYFVDKCEIGSGSRIEIKNNLDIPLVRESDYKVLECKFNAVNMTLVEELINKCKKKLNKK
jgi:hypothetical protein